MHTQHKIEEYIYQGNFDAATASLKNGESFSEQYLKNNFSQITAKIFDAKALDLLEALIKAGLIEGKKKALLDLKELLDAGILTSGEFESEKGKILKG